MKQLSAPFLLLVALAFHPLHAAEPPSAPLLRIEAGMHVATIKRISTDAAGRLVLTASDDKTARLWEMPSGRLVRVFRPPIGKGNEGKIFAGALSPDGSLAAIGGWSDNATGNVESIYLFDTTTGRMLRRLKEQPNVINDLSFSPKGRFLAAAFAGGSGLRVWEVASGREVGRDPQYGERDSYCADWFGEDKLVTTCYDGNLRLYKLSTGTGAAKLTLTKKSTVKNGKEPFSARFSPDGKKIAVGYTDSTGVGVVDGSTLAFLFAPNTTGVENGNLCAVSWSDDGATLVAGGVWNPPNRQRLRRWSNGGQGNPRDGVATGDTVMDLRPLSGGRLLFATGDPAWGVVEGAGLMELTSVGAPPLADFRDNYNGFRVSNDGTTATFGYEPKGKTPAIFSVANRELGLLKDDSFPAGLRLPRMEGLPVTDWKHNRAPKLSGTPLTLQNYESSRSLAISGDATSFLLGTDWWIRSLTSNGKERWKMPAPDVAWGVNLADSDRLALATYADGTVRWHRNDTGEELLAFFPHADRKRWVLWTPQGYYDCSPGAEDLIGWHVNRGRDQAADFYPAAKYRDQFYRPDIIQLVLTMGDVAAAVKGANGAMGRKAATVELETVVVKQAPPVVELTVGGALGLVKLAGDTDTYVLRYRVRRGGTEPVTKVRVQIDGRPVKVDAPVPSSDAAEATVTIPVPPDDCLIALSAENKFAASEPALLRLARLTPSRPPQVAEPAVLKPKLYLLAAGITDYKNNDQLEDLHFAAKDAADFTAAFRRQEGGLYQKVEARVLTDKDATASAIKDGLDWIRQETTAKDMAVIFLSGHGENDDELRYFFCAQDYDKKRRSSTGVSFEEIQRSVKAISGKVLFFIDSCHAGNALGKLYAAKGSGAQVDVTRLINELAGAENGAVVFTSSTGRQLSLELVTQNNGAFTKAIVEGLDGGADLRKNGRITVSSLEYYLAERVKELTDGQQTPTVAKPQTVPDFPIATKRQ